MNRLEIYQMTPDALQDAIEHAVRRATSDLAAKVERLQDQVATMRPVVTHKEAARIWFAGEVTPETVVRYITDHGLPATRRGRTWFIRTDDLVAWQTRPQMRKAA